MPEMPEKSRPVTTEHISVEAGDAGLRIDKLLAGRLGLSRSRIQGLIKAGAVAIAARPVQDAGQKVKSGDMVQVAVPEPAPAEPVGEDIALDVVYEDAAVIVIDKPAGLVVHPAAGHATGTLVNALIAHCGASLSGIGGVRRPGIVHRLDKDTSGLLVVAKSDAAHQSLSEQFQAHGVDGRLERRYLALVWGTPVRPTGVVEAPLQRSTQNRLKIAVAKGEHGRHALTHYRALKVYKTKDGKPLASLLELRLETGRTHQIRVHMAHIGHPVLGDQTYGAGYNTSARHLSQAAAAALSALGRQALHATALGFEHPTTGEPLSFVRPPPADMARLIAALERG